MGNISKATFLQAILLFICCCLFGCSGGTQPFLEIEGPGIVGRNSCAEYEISISPGNIAGYSWSVVPTAAGHFNNPTSRITTFTAADVAVETPVKISVVVTMDDFVAYVKTKDIKIFDHSGWACTWGAVNYTGY
jgi:hypothetical protein